MTFLDLLAVALGSAAGGVSRFALGVAVQPRLATDFPVVTLGINILGSLLLGFLLRYAVGSLAIGPELRLGLTTGFCGGFTTFSTFSYETARQIQDGNVGRATLYIVLSVGAALAATFVGFDLARRALALR